MIRTPEQHQAEHAKLHQALDELLACYAEETRRGLHSPIVDLMQWSYEKTLTPSPSPAIVHDTRDALDFEAERQIILLALAELALSRPGFEDFIRRVARRFDLTGLPTFEDLKRANIDRVRDTHAPL